MDNYKGFKVGDKVEITHQLLYSIGQPTVGIITEIQPKRIGGYAEPDIILATVNGCNFNIAELVVRGHIKKLPKYAVGDVVRVKSFEQIKREFPKLEANGVCFCTHAGKYDMSKFCGKLVTLKPHKYDGLFTIEESNGGCNWADDFLEPFDGFRVGDTVFTVKRGMGKIYSDNWIGNTKERPFAVKFGEYCFQPKLSNLIPTEAKYKEAMTGGFAVDVAFVTPYNPTPDSRLPLGKLRWYTDDEIKVNDAVLYRGKKWMVEQITRKIQPIILPEDYTIRRSDHMGGYKAVVSREDISLWKEPKFKVGDAVFYMGEKWEVSTFYGNDVRDIANYGIKSLTDCNRWRNVKESDLRLWKETKITHTDTMDRCSMIYGVSDFVSIKYIGTHINNLDIFSQDAGNGKVVVWYGIKGDDIK